MLHTQLHKKSNICQAQQRRRNQTPQSGRRKLLSCKIEFPTATDDDIMIPHLKASVAPPTLFCQPPTPETPDPFDDPFSPQPNHQMKTFIPENANQEIFFHFTVDRLAFHHLFKQFAKFGNPNRVTETMTLTNSDKWLRQAKVIDNKKLSTIDTGIYFRQIAKSKKSLNIKEYESYLDFIAKKKGMNPDEVKFKLTTSGPPKPTRLKEGNSVDPFGRLNECRIYAADTNRRHRDFNREKQKYIFDNQTPKHAYGYNSQSTFCPMEPWIPPR